MEGLGGSLRAASLPGSGNRCLREADGLLYEVVLTGRAGEPVPAGLEVAALPARLTPLEAVRSTRTCGPGLAAAGRTPVDP